MKIEPTELLAAVNRDFQESAIPSLMQFVKIRNLSMAFDPKNDAVTDVQAAIKHISDWVQSHAPEGTDISILESAKNAPMLIVDIPGTTDEVVLCYGHLDKYPAMANWSEGLSAYTPVLRDGKLFGRGSVDGGFAPYCYISAVMALARLGAAFPRCILVLETTEKSNSIHLTRYFSDVRALVGAPDVIISLDAICADYERLWYIQGYRGVIEGSLTVRMLDKDAHSGAAGMAPSALGIAFDLLNRICDLSTGLSKLDSLKIEQPHHLTTEGAETDVIAGRYFLQAAGVSREVPAITDDPATAALLPVWNSALTISTIEGLTPSGRTGGLLPSQVTLRIAVRTPPLLDTVAATTVLEKALLDRPPHNADVDFTPSNILAGWHSNELPDWLRSSVENASSSIFGRQAVGWSIGGAYPPIEILASEFPETPLFMTGIMGPDANFQVADESLNLPAACKMTASIAMILADVVGTNEELEQKICNK